MAPGEWRFQKLAHRGNSFHLVIQMTAQRFVKSTRTDIRSYWKILLFGTPVSLRPQYPNADTHSPHTLTLTGRGSWTEKSTMDVKNLELFVARVARRWPPAVVRRRGRYGRVLNLRVIPLDVCVVKFRHTGLPRGRSRRRSAVSLLNSTYGLRCYGHRIDGIHVWRDVLASAGRGASSGNGPSKVCTAYANCRSILPGRRRAGPITMLTSRPNFASSSSILGSLTPRKCPRVMRDIFICSPVDRRNNWRND